MKILITGVCGFIGRRLAQRLVGAGHEVWGIDTTPWYGKKLLNTVCTDLNNPCLFEEDVDVVFHLAALNDVAECNRLPYTTIRTNVLGTANLLQQCENASAKLVFATSAAVLDGRCYSTMYGASKSCGETLCRAFRQRGTPVHIARYFNVYGPGQRASAIVPLMIKKALAREPFTLFYGDEQNYRDFVHVDDIVAHHANLVAPDGWSGGNSSLGSGQRTSVAELHQIVRDLTDGPQAVWKERPSGDWPLIDACSAKLWNDTWRPRVELRNGLQDLIKEMR